MSLVDWIRIGPRRRDSERRQGLEPPPASPPAVLADLVWHRALYAQDELRVLDQLIFLTLRVVQRLAYNAGWRAGGSQRSDNGGTP